MSTKVTIVETTVPQKQLRMGDMKFGQICKVVETSDYKGHFVIRLGNAQGIVVNLSLLRKDECWSTLRDNTGLLVEEVPEGTKIIFEVV